MSPRLLPFLLALPALLAGCPSGTKEDTAPPAATAAPQGGAQGEGGASLGAHGEPPASLGGSPELLASGAEGPRPLATNGTAAEAKRLFAIKCSGCHGANGGGGMGPSLSSAEALGPEGIAERIKEGSPTRGMPAFGHSLKAQELEALVRYVEAL